jgi:predicted ATP-dependent endonuclease of OLD family
LEFLILEQLLKYKLQRGVVTMKLKQITINNYRAIDNLEMSFYDYTSLIGQNNTSKSTILKAIYAFINQEKMEPDDWRIGHNDEPITIGGIFNEIEDWERKMPGVAGIIQNDEINLRAKWNSAGGKPQYEAYIQQEQIVDWSSKFTDIKKSYIFEIMNELGITTSDSFKTSGNQELIKQKIRERFPEKVVISDAKWTSENISIDPALKQAIPNVEIIPAVRDASDEAKTQTTTAFGKLLNSIVMPAIQKTEEYSQLMSSVENLSKKIRGKDGIVQPEEIEALAHTISSQIAEIIDVKAILDIATPDTEKFLGSNAVIKLDDGTETSISYQGHGTQRALIFALIEALARQKAESIRHESEEKSVRSTILLFEEPELFLHPHLMRRLKKSLQKLGSLGCWQVIISTHSPFLIDVIDNPKSLILLRREDGLVKLSQLHEDPFDEDSKEALRASLDFHPTVNEAFFASKAVLVEGDTEIAILRHIDCPYKLYDISDELYYATTVISCGGKWTIVALAKILLKFKIPYRVVHDRDAHGRNENELKGVNGIDPYNANSKIREVATGMKINVIDDTFEDILWDRKDKTEEISKKDKPFRAWKEIRRIVHNKEQNDKLRELFEFVYKW